MTVVAGVRTMVVWCADWSLVAAGVDLAVPAVVLHANRVVATSPAARAEGVAPAIIEGPVAPHPNATMTPKTPESTWITVSRAHTSAPTATISTGIASTPTSATRPTVAEKLRMRERKGMVGADRRDADRRAAGRVPLRSVHHPAPPGGGRGLAGGLKCVTACTGKAEARPGPGPVSPGHERQAGRRAGEQ